jgi:alanine racemase
MPRPIVARIHASALLSNYLEAKRRTPGAKAWAVIKANAYGHGLERAARALATVADGYAVIEVDAAVRLRELGVVQPILLLEGFFDASDLDVIKANRISTALHCREQVEMLLARPDVVVPIQVKFNTGMNRLGFTAVDEEWLADRLPTLQHDGMTMMTHFADADGPSGVGWQLQVFRRFIEGWAGEVSVCNSAAILRHPEACGPAGRCWVRPGIMLYGGSPFADASATELGLEPAMTLNSELIGVQDLKPGDTVGYGRTFEVHEPMRVGVVACGYADGYPRHAPTGTPILVDGVRTRTVGRVSMDMLAVDLAPVPQARIGSPVTLWGRGLAADEVAAAAGTISYELFCALAPRVPVVED